MGENEDFRFYPPEMLSVNLRDLEKIVFYRKAFPESGYEITIKPLCLNRDIPVIHRWVNEPYAHKYWQMQGDIDGLYEHYKEFLNSGIGYSLMCFLEDKPVAQIDFYDVTADEIKDLYDVMPGDHGIHVLMAPYEKPVPGLSVNVVVTCISFLFTLTIDRIIGEPDAENERANELVKRVGFRFVKQVQMSYKTANLYSYSRKDFLKEHP